MDASKVQSVLFTLADGTATLFPVAAPAIAIVEGAIKGLEAAGVISLPAAPVDIEQVRAQAAGLEAAKASIATEIHSLEKNAEPMSAWQALADPPPGALPLASTVKP